MNAERGTLGLIRYDAMITAIAACEKVDEVKEIRDRARAFECYAKQALNLEAERKAGEIRLRAERHAGRLLKEMKRKGERQKPGEYQKSGTAILAPTLAGLGISADQSSQWQQLAAVPEAEFEAELVKPGPKPTTERLLHNLRPAPTPEAPRIDPQALTAWGRAIIARLKAEAIAKNTHAIALEAETEDLLRRGILHEGEAAA